MSIFQRETLQMSANGYMRFKSGSDIRGIGLGDGSEPLYMDDDFVSRCAAGFAEFLAKKLEVRE